MTLRRIRAQAALPETTQCGTWVRSPGFVKQNRSLVVALVEKHFARLFFFRCGPAPPASRHDARWPIEPPTVARPSPGPSPGGCRARDGSPARTLRVAPAALIASNRDDACLAQRRGNRPRPPREPGEGPLREVGRSGWRTQRRDRQPRRRRGGGARRIGWPPMPPGRLSLAEIAQDGLKLVGPAVDVERASKRGGKTLRRFVRGHDLVHRDVGEATAARLEEHAPHHRSKWDDPG